MPSKWYSEVNTKLTVKVNEKHIYKENIVNAVVFKLVTSTNLLNSKNLKVLLLGNEL